MKYCKKLIGFIHGIVIFLQAVYKIYSSIYTLISIFYRSLIFIKDKDPDEDDDDLSMIDEDLLIDLESIGEYTHDRGRIWWSKTKN